MLNQGDRVVYCGKKFASELNGKVGEVSGKVVGHDSVYVVDFEGHDQGYVLQEGRHITKRRMAPAESLSMPIRHRRTED